MPYHLPGEIPDVATLPLPSGAGATLPVSTTADVLRLPGVDPATQLPIRPGSEAPAGPGFFARLGEQLQDPKTLRTIGVGLMALGDATERLTQRGLRQPRGKTTLQQFLELEAAQESETRKSTTEQERLKLERQRVAIARTGEQRQIVEAQGKFIDTVLKNAPLVLAMDKEARAPVIQAYRERATALGLDASQLTDLFTKRETLETVSAYAPYLAHYGPGIWQQASIVKATKGEAEFFKFIEERAAGSISVAATNRVRDVVNNLERAKGAGKVSFDDVSTAMQAAAPLEWQAIIAKRGDYEPYFTSRGIKTPALAAKGAEREATKRAEAILSGEEPERVARELFAKPLGDLSQSQTVAVNALIQTRRVEISAQQGAAGVTARARAEEKEPIGPEGAATLIHPKTLASPPATMTAKDTRERGYVKVTPEQRKDLGDLGQVRTILDQIDEMSGRLITAKTPLAAAQQGIALTAGAMSRTNTLATTYAGSRQAFLGILSRQLGGERGVLTDRDINRIDASLPNFFDTASVREAKTGLLRELYTVAEETRRSAILGEAPSTKSRERIQTLLDKISGVATKAAEERLLKSLGR